MDVEEYRVAHNNGLADASVWNAELYSREVADQHWRDYMRGLAYDRRDQNLLARLRARKGDGKPVGHYYDLVLYLAAHPRVSFATDPELLP